MKVDLLDRGMVDSDLGVVNAARVSFDKESTWVDGQKGQLSAKDSKLISYLVAHQHWTPFAHAQEVFKLHMSDEDLLKFFLKANLAGFEWVDSEPLYVRGSLYAWLTNEKYLPETLRGSLMDYLTSKYYHSVNANYNTHLPYGPPSQYLEPILNPQHDELIPYTLRLHVPIFVKRQLETHRRNFVMTDIEDFSQNEVSRRYVDSEPEIYRPEIWRVQHASKKQGSASDSDALTQMMLSDSYTAMEYSAYLNYRWANQRGIAHEQSRLFLPLSTYTDFWFTGSLKSWKRMFTLRLDSHAQEETQHVAQLCYNAIMEKCDALMPI